MSAGAGGPGTRPVRSIESRGAAGAGLRPRLAFRPQAAAALAPLLLAFLLGGCASPPLSPEEQIAEGEAALALGDLEAAREAFEAVLEARPSDPRARHGLAQVRLEAGRPEAAHEILVSLRRSHPAYVEEHAAGDLRAALRGRARAALRAGRSAEALRLARELQELAPEPPDAAPLLCAALLAEAERARAASRWEASRALYREALGVDPRARAAWLGLARAQAAAGERDAAIATLADALERRPHDRELIELMVRMLGMR